MKRRAKSAKGGLIFDFLMAGFLSAHYRSKLEVPLGRGFGFKVTLLSGPEGQRLGKLKRNPSQKLTYVINARNETQAGEIRHIEGIILAITRDTETSRYLLAQRRTTIRVAGKGGGLA